MTDNNNNSAVPYFVYEGEQARHERTTERMLIALIISVALMFASNLAWLIAWCQYDYSSEVVEIDGGSGGNANYIGNDGDIYNGTDNGQETDADAQER